VAPPGNEVHYFQSHLPGPKGEPMCVSAVVASLESEVRGGRSTTGGLMYSYEVRLMPCEGIGGRVALRGSGAGAPKKAELGSVYQHWEQNGSGGHVALADSPESFACLFATGSASASASRSRRV